tara:strand:- start:5834 stop:6694 length:861 start_codon:yes stop_codon:yes gene_type:complete
MKFFTNLVIILLFVACGNDKPNRVLKTTLEINKTKKTDVDTNGFSEGHNLDDTKVDVNIDLNQLKDKITNAKEINIGSFGEFKGGDELVGTSEPHSDVTTQSSTANDNMVIVIDVPPTMDGELSENSRDATDRSTTESSLVGNSNPVKEPKKDYFGENFSISKIPDLSGQYNISNHIKEEFFKYDDLICITDFENSKAIATKVTCVALEEYTDNYKLYEYSPCIFNDRLYLHGEEWTEFKMVKISNNANGKFGNQYLNYEYKEVIYECNNGDVTSRNFALSEISLY